MTDVKSKIRAFLGEELEVDVASISDDDALFTSGLVDSYSLIELLSFLETELGYSADFADLNVDDLDSINSLHSLVANKTEEA
ncbi:acyl carrier protein [Halioxenophilus sp. WMMB6]|uniref:acyl carrier protein n=1 Tax=Halioxenophilus sp. WMMB6 TaxID=3073815 RepID=UPI00295E5C33|nr:acyl carrier protein [Halioxenophilus sp. WMMB6]